MSDFGSELARLMTARGVGVRQLARAVYCNPGHISNLRNGKARPSQELAAELDRHLGAGGVLADAVRQPVSGRQRGHARPRIGPSRAVEALQVTMSGGDGDLDVAGEGLAGVLVAALIALSVAPKSLPPRIGGAAGELGTLILLLFTCAILYRASSKMTTGRSR